MSESMKVRLQGLVRMARVLHWHSMKARRNGATFLAEQYAEGSRKYMIIARQVRAL